MSFSTLGLTPSLCSSLTRLGYEIPTPIQTQAIPAALSGTDLVARAQTGTGKTAAFGLPMIQRLAASGRGAKRRSLRGLVLVPTRELALQVHRALSTYGAPVQIRVTAIFGGVGMGGQIQSLRQGTDIVVATPGRLIDHMQRRTIDLSAIEVLTLDEADRMLDMGFQPALRRIMPALPRTRQTLLFSATLPDDVIKLSTDFTHDAVRIDVSDGQAVVATVQHHVHPVAVDRKRDLLTHVLTRKRRIRRSSSARPSGGRIASASTSGARASRRRSFTVTRARARGLARSTTSRPVASRCSSPPTSRRAASTSHSFRWSSTTICRSWPRTTFTVWVGPDGRDGRDAPCRWCREPNRDCCATCRGCCRRPSSRWSSRDSTSRARDRPPRSRSGEIGRSVRAADRTVCMSGTERGRSTGVLAATRHTRHQRHPRSERQEDDVPRRRLAPTGIHQHTPGGHRVPRLKVRHGGRLRLDTPPAPIHSASRCRR